MSQSGAARSIVTILVLSGFIAAIPVVLEAPTAEAQGGGVRTDKVSLSGIAFVPPEISILKGTTVTWTQKDSTAHTVMQTSGPTTWTEHPFAPATGVASADTFSVAFPTAGVVKYTCRIHSNMLGTIHVVEKFDTVGSAPVNVTASDGNTFAPALVQINKTQLVAWVNSGTNQHSVTFENASIGDLGDLAGGKQIQYTFNQTGNFRYRCKYHSSDFENGMVGKVSVGGNLSFPTVVKITHPTNGTVVNGTVNVTGTVKRGEGQPAVESVEINIQPADADNESWMAVQGLENWTYKWNSKNATDGEYLIEVRATAGGKPAALQVAQVMVNNTGAMGSKPSGAKKGGTPGFETPLAVAATFLALVAVARRRT